MIGVRVKCISSEILLCTHTTINKGKQGTENAPWFMFIFGHVNGREMNGKD